MEAYGDKFTLEAEAWPTILTTRSGTGIQRESVARQCYPNRSNTQSMHVKVAIERRGDRDDARRIHLV
jgi:hypothetical protein